MTTASLIAAVQAYVDDRIGEWDQIPDARKSELIELGSFIRKATEKRSRCPITFVCTHNSRRSHLAQVWAAIAAEYYGIPLETFSGGTEATAMNERIVACLCRTGLQVESVRVAAPLGDIGLGDGVIDRPGRDGNPKYHVRYSEMTPPLECFSKVYDQSPNPKSNFIAVMVCSDADQRCPTVSGADHRVVIKYVDPKVSDDTDQESDVYDERCRQIAREMLFLVSQAKAS
ncbi:MAG: protein-tyrosine-phosphatase [Planctomycetota bacterium]